MVDVTSLSTDALELRLLHLVVAFSRHKTGLEELSMQEWTALTQEEDAILLELQERKEQ